MPAALCLIDKRPVAAATGLSKSLLLRELDPVGARTLLARLDLERHALAARERIEVHGRVKPCPMEEVLLPVLSRDEAEPAVRDQLFYGPCGHRQTPLLENWLRTHGSFREDPTAANIARLPGTDLHYHRLRRTSEALQGEQGNPRERGHGA